MIFRRFTIQYIFQILICAIFLFSHLVMAAENIEDKKDDTKTIVEDRIDLIQSSIFKEKNNNLFDSLKYSKPILIPTECDMMTVTSSGRMSL